MAATLDFDGGPYIDDQGKPQFRPICEQGATFRFTLFVYQPLPDPLPTPPPSRVPIDLTGCTARMMVRASYAAAQPIVTLATATGELAINGPAGTITMTLTAAQTLALPVPKSDCACGPSPCGMLTASTGPPTTTYVYDLDLTYPDGTIFRLIQGAFVVSATATR